jgi:TonB family protein
MAIATVVLGGLAVSARAQHLLVVEHDGKPCLVVGAEETRPRIELNGKVVAVRGSRFALRTVGEYLPFFVAVRDLEARSSYNSVNGADAINNQFHFRATLETAYRLENVFLVLDLDTSNAGRTFFLYEVGRLEPREPRIVSLTAPLGSPLGAGQYHFHLFSGGPEVLHSEIPAADREQVLDRMTAKRLEGAADGGPKPFVGPAPAYPPALRRAGVKGQAVVSLWIRVTGSVRDPVVKSATDPAFGEAALAAARLWRFLPRVKEGQAVETKVDLPFVFAPPGAPPEKS